MNKLNLKFRNVPNIEEIKQPTQMLHFVCVTPAHRQKHCKIYGKQLHRIQKTESKRRQRKYGQLRVQKPHYKAFHLRLQGVMDACTCTSEIGLLTVHKESTKGKIKWGKN